MKPVYLDHNVLIAYYLKSHPNHKNAVIIVASLIRDNRTVVCSLEGIYEAIKTLTQELQFIKRSQLFTRKIESEKLVMDRIRSFMEKLKITLVSTFNEHVLSQMLALVTEYHIRFEVAFFTAIMLEHKIQIIATFDKAYGPLITEGFLVQYGSETDDEV